MDDAFQQRFWSKYLISAYLKKFKGSKTKRKKSPSGRFTVFASFGVPFSVKPEWQVTGVQVYPESDSDGSGIIDSMGSNRHIKDVVVS